MQNNSEVVMDRNVVVEVNGCVANILRLASDNGRFENFCFVVDNPSNMRLWASADLDPSIVSALRVGSEITYSAERDEDGDMIITKLKLNA